MQNNSKHEWISVKDKLPKLVKSKDGSVNCVLACWKPDLLAEYVPNPQVCNVAFFKLHLDRFTHWMEIPELPKE